MIGNYQSKVCTVYDNGLFVEIAIRLSKDFGKVYYYTPWESGFPKSNDLMVGSGLPEIIRVNNFYDVIDETDLFVFPDVYSGSIQTHLDKLGKRVWGSRFGDTLELYRKETKDYMKSLGIPVGPWEEVEGLDNLRKYLKSHKNQYVKVSFTRGDMETFGADNYNLVEPKLDELEHKLGAKKHIIKFIVEDAIEDAVEIGYDGYTIDGKFPSKCMWGIEIKDRGYVGMFANYADVPWQIRDNNKKLANALKDYKYKNFFSTELRVTKDGTPYAIDPCCRAGSPPSEVYQNMYTNLADILWFGAEGTVIDPIPAGKWGAEMLIHSEWADKNWQSVEFPKELRDNIKFRNLTIIKGKYYVVPHEVGLPEIAAVVACDDTMKGAIEKVKEMAEELKGYYITLHPDALDHAEEEMSKLKEYNVEVKESSKDYKLSGSIEAAD